MPLPGRLAALMRCLNADGNELPEGRGSTMWDPTLPRVRPLYQGIVAALERDIGTGRLSRGRALPTHRELARSLGVTIGTVTKAYTEAERRGLVVSRVGRGSYVLQFPEHVTTADIEPNGLVDLSINTMTIEPLNTVLNRVLGALSRRKSLYGLLKYAVSGARIGAAWLPPAPSGLRCEGSRRRPIE